MNVESTYSFGLPGLFVWTTHIIIGILLAYVGYNVLNKKPINPNWGILLLILGVMAGLYHTHIWYLNRQHVQSTKQNDYSNFIPT